MVRFTLESSGHKSFLSLVFVFVLCLVNYLIILHIKESNEGNTAKSRIFDSRVWVPDSTVWIPYCKWDLNSRFQSLVGLRIRWVVSCIPKSRVPQAKKNPIFRISNLVPPHRNDSCL